MCLFTTTLESTRVAGLVEEEIGKAWKLVDLEFIFLLEAQTLLDKVKAVGDVKTGVMIVRRAIEEPVRQIAHNAGLEGAVIVD